MQEISRLVEGLLASQEGLCSVQLLSLSLLSPLLFNPGEGITGTLCMGEWMGTKAERVPLQNRNSIPVENLTQPVG